MLFKKYFAEIKDKIEEVEQGYVEEKINLDENCIILDIRKPAEWNKSHLSKSVCCDRGMLELNIEKISPDLNQEIIIYCGGGTRSALACDTLKNMGYKNVKSLKDGFRGWVQAGLNVES